MSMLEFVVSWTIIYLCGIGVTMAGLGWVWVNLSDSYDEWLRQGVRAELEAAEHEAMRSSFVFCETHLSVSKDFCEDCRVEELTQRGYVVHC